MKKIIKTALPLGFKANGLASGIKRSGRPDIGLIFSQRPAKAVGLFTTNKIISGSVRLSQINLKKSRQFQAIFVNSSNANCFTKHHSFKDAQDIAAELAHLLRIRKREVLFASTGIIGQPLPVGRIKKSIPSLIEELSESGLLELARAIITTDTFIKVSTTVVGVGKKSVTVCGLAKGAGMIAPNLACKKATMLCFILSDADITQKALSGALKDAVDNSFNCITIDACMSTNDTVILMSNSCANNPKIVEGSKDFNKFSSALKRVCLDLAKMIVRDAEGATKFIQIKIEQARSFQEARQIALSIANSNLFKTAMFGRSRNLGRIVAAIGASGVDAKEENIKINVSPLNKKNIYIGVKLGCGKSEAIVYTSDLTPGYIKINAHYK